MHFKAKNWNEYPRTRVEKEARPKRGPAYSTAELARMLGVSSYAVGSRLMRFPEGRPEPQVVCRAIKMYSLAAFMTWWASTEKEQEK